MEILNFLKINLILMKKKIDKFSYFYSCLLQVHNTVSKIQQLLGCILNLWKEDCVDELILNRLFVIKYDLVKNLWKSYNIAKEQFKKDGFVGFILIWSRAKWKWVLFWYKDLGDIDIIMVFEKYNGNFKTISWKIINIILENTGLKKCDFWNWENEVSVVFLDKLEEYLKNWQYEKFVFLFSPFFCDTVLKRQIRSKVAKLVLTKASDREIEKMDKRFKFNILPLYSHWPLGPKLSKSKNRFMRNWVRLFNYMCQYLASSKWKRLRITFRKIWNISFRDLLQRYL